MSASARRVALVTGGAGAIGAAVCRDLAIDGCVVAVADLDEASAKAVADGLVGDGHIGVSMDVSEPDIVRDAVAAVTAALGPIDVLANVAGWDRFVAFVDTEPDFWERVIAINYRGVLNAVHAVLPSMIERGAGAVVSVASDAARVGSSLESVYAGAKGAVVAFSKSVAREVARNGITVNVVCPGPTDTPMIRSMAAAMGQGESFIDALIRAVPMRRLAKPGDIAHAVVFLTSPRASYITGQTLSVSGGLTMV